MIFAGKEKGYKFMKNELLIFFLGTVSWRPRCLSSPANTGKNLKYVFKHVINNPIRSQLTSYALWYTGKYFTMSCRISSWSWILFQMKLNSLTATLMIVAILLLLVFRFIATYY